MSIVFASLSASLNCSGFSATTYLRRAEVSKEGSKEESKDQSKEESKDQSTYCSSLPTTSKMSSLPVPAPALCGLGCAATADQQFDVLLNYRVWCEKDFSWALFYTFMCL